jgi:hypothetical protein
MLKKSGAGFNLAMAALGVFILAHVIFATTTKSPALFIFWAASAAATAFATHNAAQFLRKTFSRLPSALIVTPCHFIETGPDGVSYTPITDYYKISVSEMTKENKYKVEFEVSGRKTRFTAFCANGVKQIIFTINSHRRRAEDLLASCSLAELARHDDLNGLNVNADRPPPPRRRFPGLTIHVVAQAACLILYMDAAIHLYFPSHHKTGAPAAAERIIHR